MVESRFLVVPCHPAFTQSHEDKTSTSPESKISRGGAEETGSDYRETGARGCGVKPTFTAESVAEGHPDKLCDLIADRILDECMTIDPQSKVACEVMCKDDCVVLGGEIGVDADVEYEEIIRSVLEDVGYTCPRGRLRVDNFRVVNLISKVSPRLIGSGIDSAGDQGMVFGYATLQTPSLMPLPIVLAHRLTEEISLRRKQGAYPWLRPDSKAQVTVDTGGSTESAEPARVKSVVVSTQHSSEIDLRCLREELRSNLIPDILNGFLSGDAEILVNPLGHFDVGGPEADCGVTGRKLMVDTYGAWARHGGGAFSGKDPSKVDRSGAYFARYAARQVVKRGLAREVEIQVSYAPGVNSPISVSVDSKGSGEDPLILDFLSRYDFSLPAIVDFLKLKRPIYSATTNYGHFGKRGVSWED